jgi:hypothetical protein
MLPGFRFLFAAIVLSMSVLVFGLGAAALMRAAHEEFVSNPSWRAAPETVFARQNEATRPALAMLRVEPPAVEKTPDEVPVAPAEPAATVAVPAEQAAVPSPLEPDNVAAVEPDDASPPEPAKSEIPVAESPATAEAAPAPADAPAPAAATRIAATEPAKTEPVSPVQVSPPVNQAAPAGSEPPEPAAPRPTASEQMSAPVSPETGIAVTKIATLGGPPVTTETPPPAGTAGANPDRIAIKKRQQARRAAQRRRMAARARLAQQAQQPVNPFAQPLTPVHSH